jgi:hypothetical protein
LIFEKSPDESLKIKTKLPEMGVGIINPLIKFLLEVKNMRCVDRVYRKAFSTCDNGNVWYRMAHTA